MKRLMKWILTIAILVGAMALPLLAAASGDKVSLCHKPGTPDEVMLEVSVNALDAHLAHGDYVGECSLGTLTCPFEATTIPVIGSDPVKYTVDFPEPPSEFGWTMIISANTYLYQMAATPMEQPIEKWWTYAGGPDNVGWPNEVGAWDIYVMKLEPTDPDFNHVVSCIDPRDLVPEY